MWGTPVEIETRRRIKLSLWAYAYEFENHSIVSDAIFDSEARLLNLGIATNRPDLDFFFMLNFVPCTGMWIQKHPELDKIRRIYEQYHRA